MGDSLPTQGAKGLRTKKCALQKQIKELKNCFDQKKKTRSAQGNEESLVIESRKWFLAEYPDRKLSLNEARRLLLGVDDISRSNNERNLIRIANKEKKEAAEKRHVEALQRREEENTQKKVEIECVAKEVENLLVENENYLADRLMMAPNAERINKAYEIYEQLKILEGKCRSLDGTWTYLVKVEGALVNLCMNFSTENWSTKETLSKFGDRNAGKAHEDSLLQRNVGPSVGTSKRIKKRKLSNEPYEGDKKYKQRRLTANCRSVQKKFEKIVELSRDVHGNPSKFFTSTSTYNGNNGTNISSNEVTSSRSSSLLMQQIKEKSVQMKELLEQLKIQERVDAPIAAGFISHPTKYGERVKTTTFGVVSGDEPLGSYTKPVHEYLGSLWDAAFAPPATMYDGLKQSRKDLKKKKYQLHDKTSFCVPEASEHSFNTTPAETDESNDDASDSFII